jgi:hypothetical protein
VDTTLHLRALATMMTHAARSQIVMSMAVTPRRIDD